MSDIDLVTLLRLVGPLDDSQDPNSASARFRAYLLENVHSVSDLRVYIETALSTSGDQYNKALQDLVNHTGHLLGFDVRFGRYRGVRGEIGYDGLWRSPEGHALVVEVKTTDVYTVKTATLLGYRDALVSAGELSEADEAIGLYVYGRFDVASSQLEKAIMAERRQEQLRVVSAVALLNLLELQQEYELEHETVFQLLLPPPVRVDTFVNLIFDITSQERRSAVEEPPPIILQTEKPVDEKQPSYYLLPAADSEDGLPVLENLHHWLDQGLWGLGQRTGYRKEFQPGDKLCFYAVRIGIVAECTASSAAFSLDRKSSPKPHLDVPYGIRVEKIRWFEDEPVVLTPAVRAELSAFEDRDLKKGWAWFVQGTSKLNARDFRLLTGRISTTDRPATTLKEPARRGPPSVLISIPEKYTGKKVRAIVFQGTRYGVHTWKDAMLSLFEALCSKDQPKFEQTALTLIGRKRPFITRDSKALRAPQRISKSDSLYVETNLDAQTIVKVCYTLVTKLGYPKSDLVFETA